MKTAIERFEALYEPEPMSGGWIWIGQMMWNGSGAFSLHGKRAQAQRVSYEPHIGPIPDGLVGVRTGHVPHWATGPARAKFTRRRPAPPAP